MGALPFSSPADTPEKKKERGPSLGGVGGGGGGQERRRAFPWSLQWRRLKRVELDQAKLFLWLVVSVMIKKGGSMNYELWAQQKQTSIDGSKTCAACRVKHVRVHPPRFHTYIQFTITKPTKPASMQISGLGSFSEPVVLIPFTDLTWSCCLYIKKNISMFRSYLCRAFTDWPHHHHIMSNLGSLTSGWIRFPDSIHIEV